MIIDEHKECKNAIQDLELKLMAEKRSRIKAEKLLEELESKWDNAAHALVNLFDVYKLRKGNGPKLFRDCAS